MYVLMTLEEFKNRTSSSIYARPYNLIIVDKHLANFHRLNRNGYSHDLVLAVWEITYCLRKWAEGKKTIQDGALKRFRHHRDRDGAITELYETSDRLGDILDTRITAENVQVQVQNNVPVLVRPVSSHSSGTHHADPNAENLDPALIGLPPPLVFGPNVEPPTPTNNNIATQNNAVPGNATLQAPAQQPPAVASRMLNRNAYITAARFMNLARPGDNFNSDDVRDIGVTKNSHILSSKPTMQHITNNVNSLGFVADHVQHCTANEIRNVLGRASDRNPIMFAVGNGGNESVLLVAHGNAIGMPHLTFNEPMFKVIEGRPDATPLGLFAADLEYIVRIGTTTHNYTVLPSLGYIRLI